MSGDFLPWFGAGAALAAVPVIHWLAVRRTVAVSGRMSALVNRVRFGQFEEPQMSQEDLVAAMRAMTELEFGDEGLGEVPDPEAMREPGAGFVDVKPKQGALAHILFLVGLMVGGTVAALATGGFEITPGLRGALFATMTGDEGWVTPIVLAFGGMLVGFGTRMSGGCTSGHGLCGVSRFQTGSVAATMAFFGAGIATSFALETLL